MTDVVDVVVDVIEVVVHGRAAPKGSRKVGHTKDGRAYTYPASRHELPWVKVVADETMIVMRHREAPTPPYHVELDLRIARPASYRTRRSPYPTQHDIDKLARAVIDGLVKGGAMIDDRHIISMAASKVFSDEPGVTARVHGPVPF